MLTRLLRVLARGNPADARAADAAAAGQRVREAAKRYQSGDAAAAAALCRAALALDPRQAEAWSLLARLALGDSQLERALECYAQVLAIDPDAPDYLVDAGEVNRRAGHVSRALELSERALALRPDDSRAWRVRHSALEELGRPGEAVECLRRVVELEPGDVVAHSDLLFLLNRSGVASAAQVLAEHRAWAGAHADQLAPAVSAFANPPQPERVLRIGYVSADFRDHAVAYFIEPVLRQHDPTRCEVYCYFSWPHADTVTQRLRPLAHHWRDIAAMSDEAAARLVRDDGIDILVDLSGHTLGNRLLLFARRPAPIQMTWLGYIGTTGMKAIDCLVTDAWADPPGVADADYSESLLRLPHGRWCYQPPQNAPAVSALPAAARGFPTFGSFNKFARLSVDTLRAWGRLLQRLPRARLRVIGVAPGESCDRMLQILEDEGVFAERIEILGRLPFDAFLQQYREVDIALDPYPYNGATTACHSLWMGVPVVSRCGRSGAARSGASILTNAGLAQLVAQSWEEYLDIVQGLAADVGALAQLRATLRQRVTASPLMDAPGFTRGLETAFRVAWQEWCARATAGRTAC